jgi:carboxylate-amine ligase
MIHTDHRLSLSVDPATGVPLPVAREVIDVGNGFGTELQQEITRVQVESATPVCGGMREVRAHLLAARSVAAAAALQAGGQLLAVVVPSAGQHGVCGCHVHVAVPDRETASAGHYDAVPDVLVDSGAVLDRAMIYWDVRPSDHLPTVERGEQPLPVSEQAVLDRATGQDCRPETAA